MLASGQLFFALKGPNFNGNAYAVQALEKGARAVVVEEPIGLDTPKVVQVPDALLALQSLAHWHRQVLNLNVLAITGSNGKTTTKELCQRVLAATGKPIWATPGNFNNHIGLPLSVLGAIDKGQTVVLEMGDNQPGDIAELAAIAEPDAALITNIGLDHLGGYDSLEANAAGKLELFQAMPPRKVLIVNEDDEYLAPYSQSVHHFVLRYSAQNPVTEVYGQVVENRLEGIRVSVSVNGEPPQTVQTQLPGRYNLHNVLAAVAVGRWAGVPLANALEAIAAYRPANNRSQLVQLPGGSTLLLDAYNANPSSVIPALESLHEATQGSTVGVVLADMLELGTESSRLHSQVGQKLAELQFPYILLIGPEYKAVAETLSQHLPNVCWAPTTAQAKQAFEALVPVCQYLLIKGSRAFALEGLLQRE
jgi:UDP-N-acetylmuramoyl-tripeptide--D-alanyl-D-alanine ligase